MYAALRKLKLLVGSGGLDFTKGMDSLHKHVQHISFRQWVTVWEHRQLKGWQPHVQLTVAKISIWQLFTGLQQSRRTTESTITILYYIVTILGTITPWPDPLLLCIWQVCSAAATKGWAWCHHLMQRWRNVLRLTGTSSFWQVGCLEFQKGIAGMDSLNKHVQQISFRQCVTFWEHPQLKGWPPRFQPTEAKCSISTIVPWFRFATVTCHTWEHYQKPANLGQNHCIGRNKSCMRQLRGQTLCFSA